MTTSPRHLAKSAWRWARSNLFSSPANTLLTLLVLAGAAAIARPIFNWAIGNASWSASDDRACAAAGGACWAFLREWYRFILFGRYPFDQQWRPALAILILVALLLASCDRRLWGRGFLVLWTAGLAAAFLLMWGGIAGLPFVEAELWNGLPLTLILAIGGLAFGFPLAVLVALGRRSAMPAIRALSIAYIEIFRGLPLITVLFMGSVLLPLFLPPQVTLAKVWRAEIAFTLFFAAYLAEVVRGGLQAIPRGQYEAAAALGFGYWRQMRLIILPQALTIAIPPLVNTFIGALKDTALVTAIGLFDLLQDANTALNDPAWRSAYPEAYLFVAAIYFAFCYFMSRYSRSLEARMARGRR